MSQSNMNVGNVSAPQFRSDMNAALQALASTSSGSAAPSTTYANQLWYDTTANILKMRNEANSAWINLLYIEQTGAVRVLDDTQVVNTSGVQTGLLGDQTTATWQAGTGTVESLVSPAKIKAAINALAGVSTSAVLTATAGATAGAVGTYALLGVAANSSSNYGDTRAGSGLYPAGFRSETAFTASGFSVSSAGQNSVRAGTWRCMGVLVSNASGFETPARFGATLWLRIS